MENVCPLDEFQLVVFSTGTSSRHIHSCTTRAIQLKQWQVTSQAFQVDLDSHAPTCNQKEEKTEYRMLSVHTATTFRPLTALAKVRCNVFSFLWFTSPFVPDKQSSQRYPCIDCFNIYHAHICSYGLQYMLASYMQVFGQQTGSLETFVEQLCSVAHLYPHRRDTF